MAKISIIVPVYNVSKYLKRSLDSLINQTLKDLEIIIVNDGSTDNSLDICQEYASLDNRIKVISKENGGPSSARNYGLRYVTSDYVAFIDSDDYVALDMYETMYGEMQNNICDTIFCNFYIQDNKEQMVAKQEVSERMTFTDNDVFEKLFLGMVGTEPSYPHTARYFMTVWHAIYSMKIIRNFNLHFKDFIAEDLVFHCDYLSHAKDVIYIPKCLYYYCWNGSSLSNTYNDSRFVKDLDAYNYVSCMLVKCNKSYLVNADKFLLLRIRLDIFDIVDHCLTKKNSISAISKIMNRQEVTELYERYRFTKLTFKHLILFLLFKYSSSSQIYRFIKLARRFSK